jgi:hypothetical protein
MFALDLFNNDHERRIAEGAVDQLEQRRIDDLAMKMDDLVARAKNPAYKKNPAALAALMKEFQKCKAERDSYYKVRNETMGYGGLTAEAGIPGNVPTEKIPGKEDLLKGKGRTYYEGTEENDDWYDANGRPNPRRLDPGNMEEGQDETVLDKYKKRVGTLGNLQKDNERYQDKRDSYHAVSTNFDRNLERRANADTDDKIERMAIDRDRLRQNDADWKDTFDMMRDRINRYQWSSQGSVNPKKLKKISSIKYQPTREEAENAISTDAKGRTQQQWIKLVQAKFPTAKIMQAKMIDGTVFATLPDGRKISWKKVETSNNQKKNSSPVKEHGGGIGPRQHWQDLMPEQTNPEDDDWYDDEEDQETELRSGDYVRDTMDGESGEVFRMQGDPYERRVRILDRDGKGWYIEPSRLTRVDPQDPDVQRYFGKQRQRDMDEAIVASGPSQPLDDRAVRKLVWDTMKINADSGEQAIQRALSVLAKKPQSRMVQDLQDKFQSLADRLAQGVAEGWSDAIVARRTGSPRTPYSVYIKGKKWKDFDNEDLARAVMNKLKAKFKADGRDPETVTIAPTDYDQPIKEEQDTSGVERAILNRIMTAHTDLLMKFGPDKVMQAAEEVAYNVGDVDEIGTSDVSAYVHQVKQILGVPEELDEKWSQKYKSSINCANPKGFSQKAHCAGRKK